MLGILESAKLYVVSAPSGAGKTSLVHAAISHNPRLQMSVSYTTRPRREHEVDGKDYFFVSVDEFNRIRDRGELLEHAQVFDNFYGTGRQQIENHIAAGHSVILEIDWQGARQVRETMPDSRSVFVLPPSRAELERRLRARKTDSDEVIERRLRDSVADMTHCTEFDFVVVNDDFDKATNELGAVLGGRGDACRADRSALKPLLQQLLGNHA